MKTQSNLVNEKKNNADNQDLLQELREFIGVQTNEVYVKKTVPFEAITEGLGLESPRKPEIDLSQEKNQKEVAIIAEAYLKKTPPPIPAKKTSSLHSTLTKPETKQPPPLPKATYSRRFFAGAIDHLLVLTFLFFSLGLAVRWGVINSDFIDVSNWWHHDFLVGGLKVYFGFWIVYLAFSVGLLESTLGMWILGLQLKFGPHQEAKGLKKTARVILGALLHALVFPNLFLLFHRHGRNILDTLSSTQVYRTA